jgi:hypothetical protein
VRPTPISEDSFFVFFCVAIVIVGGIGENVTFGQVQWKWFQFNIVYKITGKYYDYMGGHIRKSKNSYKSNNSTGDILWYALDQAIKSVYPQAKIQLCIVHQIRTSLRYVPHKDKKAVVADLKAIYPVSTAEDGLANLDAFATIWDSKFPTISKSWYNNWEKLSAMFEFTQPIRKIIYTTNAIESLNMTLRKVINHKRPTTSPT